MYLFLLFLLLPVFMNAQLPAPSSMGVAMGHLHLNTTDVEASRKFWVDFMGASVTKLGQTEVFKFPDALVMVRKGAVSGGSDGSAVNHLGFKVKDLSAYLAKCEKFGVKIERRMEETKQAFILAPDNIRIELSEDASMTAPIAHHHIHFFNTAVMETQAWYAKMFGAKPGKRGRFDAADLPGVNLTFSPSDKPTVPTKGRAVDHIGFEIRNLEEFVKQLEAKGVKFDIPFRKVPQLGLSIAFFTDPWGTYVELTEGLDKL
ncbi:MAG: VOC family protein [Candidatus Solibacter usitatus]|nr:VOC family protein [Candidatus Solibacter usitatus]